MLWFQEPAGLINCFEAFSTFQCKPIVNVRDIVVVEEFRGQGISHLLLLEVENMAVEKNCCKITLEVLERNTPAKNSYIKFGFKDYELDPTFGKAMFWGKSCSK
jgi:ribosomal protein S18 acetylase RimI-like enzyme